MKFGKLKNEWQCHACKTGPSKCLYTKMAKLGILENLQFSSAITGAKSKAYPPAVKGNR